MFFNVGIRARDWIWNLWLSALSCRWLAKLSGPGSRIQLCNYRLRDFCDVFLGRLFHDFFSMFTSLLAPFSYSSLWSHQPHFRGSATNGSISVVCFTSYAKCQAFDTVLICFRKRSSHEILSCRLITLGDLVEHVGFLTMLYLANISFSCCAYLSFCIFSRWRHAPWLSAPSVTFVFGVNDESWCIADWWLKT